MINFNYKFFFNSLARTLESPARILHFQFLFTVFTKKVKNLAS